MELCQSKSFTVFDDHDRRIGHIDTYFDNHSRYKNIDCTGCEFLHDRIFFVLLHAAVYQTDPQFRIAFRYFFIQFLCGTAVQIF